MHGEHAKSYDLIYPVFQGKLLFNCEGRQNFNHKFWTSPWLEVQYIRVTSTVC